jgi:3-oxoacyl-ACP reductase-like protein
MNKNYHHSILYNIKKITLIYFLFAVWKKNSIRDKKKIKEENKIENILKGKKLQENKLVIDVLGIALLYTTHSIIEENILFEDGDDANTPHAFNLT